MHKKLEADLISLAHSVLQMKNRNDVFALEEKAKELANKLSMLAFVETYITTTPNLQETKESIIDKVEKAFELKNLKADEVLENMQIKEDIINDDNLKSTVDDHSLKEELPILEEIIEQPFDELEEMMFTETSIAETTEQEVEKEASIKASTIEEELAGTISVDEIATLFDTPSPVTLNDTLSKNIQIGLNDRIAFVKNLFDGSQEDFNRVVSQLNTFNTEKEALDFVNQMVKPDYNWVGQEVLESRFIEIVARKFV